MKGILCIKFDLFKLNIDFWVAYARTLGFSQNLDWEMGIAPPPPPVQDPHIMEQGQLIQKLLNLLIFATQTYTLCII